ncbi:MAG: hypothetical protein ACFE9P_12890 [Candidatus Hermodarchaeota archaeon]
MFREVYKEGDKTKSGALDKRGLAPWNKLKVEVNEILLKSYEKVKEMKKNPDLFNVPEFGPCGTCPYHNIEVNYKSTKVICTG